MNDRPPDLAVRDLIDRHGLRPILVAVLGFALRGGRDPAQRRPEEMSAHLRRDIGLTPMPERVNYWDLR